MASSVPPQQKEVILTELIERANVDPAQVDVLKNEVGELLVNEILIFTSKQESPTESDQWTKGLSEAYEAKKGNPLANLRLEPELLTASSLQFEATPDGVKVGIFDTGQDPKASGHNQWSGYEHKWLPVRRFIPEGEEKFKASIHTKIDDIIALYERPVETPDILQPTSAKPSTSKKDLKAISDDDFIEEVVPPRRAKSVGLGFKDIQGKGLENRIKELLRGN